jgi:hypothetical protein
MTKVGRLSLSPCYIAFCCHVDVCGQRVQASRNTIPTVSRRYRARGLTTLIRLTHDAGCIHVGVMAHFWWRLKAQSILNLETFLQLWLPVRKVGWSTVDRAVSCQLSAPAELQGQKATQNHSQTCHAKVRLGGVHS